MKIQLYLLSDQDQISNLTKKHKQTKTITQAWFYNNIKKQQKHNSEETLTKESVTYKPRDTDHS